MSYKPVVKYEGYYLTVRIKKDGNLLVRPTEAYYEFVKEDFPSYYIIDQLWGDIVSNTPLENIEPAAINMDTNSLLIGTIKGSDYDNWQVDKLWYYTENELLNIKKEVEFYEINARTP